MAVAESWTGGLIGHRITNIAGSSEYYCGSINPESNEAKERLLGVRHETLLSFGAVSRQTALEMAGGVRRALQTDVGLAVTGIAGPGGGTLEKPVGTVWIGLDARGRDAAGQAARQAARQFAWYFCWEGDRIANKIQSAEAALRLLEEFLRHASD